MATERASVDVIQSAIDDFTAGIPAMERKQFDSIYAMLKDLSLDEEGKIKSTIDNLKIINRVKNELDSLTSSDKFLNKVSDLQDVVSKVTSVQTAYLGNAFSDFEAPKLLPYIEKQAFENTVSSLTDAGINENVLTSASDILEQHLRDGSSFKSLVDKLEETMVSSKETDSKLLSYSKQIINDTMSNYAREYHALVTDDLGLQYFGYVGALVDASRPLCRALVKKHWIHESELASIARGEVDGQNGMTIKGKFHKYTEGLMPGTNGSNFQTRCAGYNCTHQLVPVPSDAVPTSIRRKFEDNVNADNAELADSRPRRKK